MPSHCLLVAVLCLIAASQASCPKGAIFCENFESKPTKGWKLQGAANITSYGPVRGKRSLHLTPVGGKFGRLMLNFSPKRNSFFGRIYLRVKKLPTAPNYSHWLFVEVLGADKGDEQIRPLNGQLINEVGGLNMWGVGSDHGVTGDWTKWKESAVAEEDVWTCMEWQMEASDSSVRVWINSVEKPELEVSHGNHGGKEGTNLTFPRKMEKIWFGFWNFQDNTTPAKFDAYIDDIVLHHKRIGCE